MDKNEIIEKLEGFAFRVNNMGNQFILNDIYTREEIKEMASLINQIEKIERKEQWLIDHKNRVKQINLLAKRIGKVFQLKPELLKNDTPIAYWVLLCVDHKMYADDKYAPSFHFRVFEPCRNYVSEKYSFLDGLKVFLDFHEIEVEKEFLEFLEHRAKTQPVNKLPDKELPTFEDIRQKFTKWQKRSK
jgi:hypothetical protein